MKELDKYEILEEIGRGGFAVVYKARDTKMDRDVALKVITGNFVQESRFVERFRQEVRTAANLRHKNIVPVHDFGEANGALYLAMTLIGEGHTLSTLLAEQGPLCLKNALSILTPLAEALDYLHRRIPPLIHRDVKPANVLLEGEGDDMWVVLTDFGLVRSMKASTELTKTGGVLGTPAYIAPEQADPKQWGEVTPLTDVYAIGVIAYEMLTGHTPFEGEAMTVLHAHAYEPIPSPLEIVPDLGNDLSATLLCALAKSPSERYPTAGEFVRALQEVAHACTEAAERMDTLEQLEAQARQLLDAGEWLEALDCCTQMVRLDPNRPAALEMLTAAKEGLDQEQGEATARRRLNEKYIKATQLLEQRQWTRATTLLKEILDQNPDFRDAAEQLEKAKNEVQKAEWLRKASLYAESEQWPEACDPLIHLLEADPDNYSAVAIAVQVMRGLLSTLQEHSRHERLQVWAHFDALVEALENDDPSAVLEAARKMLTLIAPPPTVDEVQSRWLEITNALRPRNLSLEALVRSAVPAAVEDGNTIVLQFTHNFHRAKVMESRNKELVEDVISEVLGQPTEVRCILQKDRTDF